MVRKTQVCRSRFENVRTSAAKVRNEKWGYPFKIHFYKRFQGHRNIKHARVWYFRVRVAQFLFETFFHIVRVLLDFSVVRYKSDTLYIYCLDVCVGWRLYEKYPSSASRSRSSRSAWLVIHSMYLSTYILSWKDLIYGTHMRRSLSLSCQVPRHGKPNDSFEQWKLRVLIPVSTFHLTRPLSRVQAPLTRNTQNFPVGDDERVNPIYSYYTDRIGKLARSQYVLIRNQVSMWIFEINLSRNEGFDKRV